LNDVIEGYREALRIYVRGDPEPALGFFSQRDDVTLANPFGPVRHGWAQAEAAMTRAAANWRNGVVVGFERVATWATDALACIVEVERLEGRIGAREEFTPVTLRTTSVFRTEDGVWRIVHRHADPITSDRPAQSVITSG
jgi:ketosteroid isomerase-like protein